MFEDQRKLIHTVSNKLTAALGYLDLAETDATNRIEYMRKANRELKEAAAHVKALMFIINGMAQTASKAADEAMRLAHEMTQDLAKATEAADEMAKKAATVKEQVDKIVPISKPLPPPIPFERKLSESEQRHKDKHKPE